VHSGSKLLVRHSATPGSECKNQYCQMNGVPHRNKCSKADISVSVTTSTTRRDQQIALLFLKHRFCEYRRQGDGPNIFVARWPKAAD
jgi:hypothetical protein